VLAVFAINQQMGGFFVSGSILKSGNLEVTITAKGAFYLTRLRSRRRIEEIK
jgi:siroheme synthase (precorrin-2 oxidase/ferrochelatase)